MLRRKIIATFLCVILVISYGTDCFANDNYTDTDEMTIEDELDKSEGSEVLEKPDESDGSEELEKSDESEEPNEPDKSEELEEPEEYHGYWVDILDDIDGGYTEAQNEILNEDFHGDDLLQAIDISKYDSRNYGYITSVKNQSPYQTCWAFAALGSGEASMIKQGYASLSDEPDYSEYQLAYFLYHDKQDPLHNIDNDRVIINSSTDYLNLGGSSICSVFALAGWVGAVDETVVPYYLSYNKTVLANNYAFNKDSAHLQNAYIVSSVSDYPSEVKSLIKEYGAVASGVFFGQNLCYVANNGDVTYNYTGSFAMNHAIMIIGWDDNYPKENFRSGSQPSSDGAWLIKNSWGSTASDSYPYIWVSYEDVSISKSPAIAYVFEPADNYDFNYQYDGICGYGTLTLANPTIANVYTAAGAAEESIDAVSFALYQRNVEYSIQIYLNPTDDTNPQSGVPMLKTPQTGTTSYMGYMTVPLDNSVTVKKGDRFAVVVSFKSLTGYVRFFVDMDQVAYDGRLTFDSSTSRGQSFYKQRYDSKFHDCYDYEDANDLCFKLKAYTNVISSGSQKESGNTSSQTVNMYRLYNPNSGEHFYTSNSKEKDNLVKVGWRYEGIGWKAPKTSKTPVYRLYNKNAGDHHYTMSATERDFLVSVGWKYEGIGWYSDDSKSVPLYRQYNPNAKAGSHNYTVSKSENDMLVSVGWKGEGIGWYGVK
ncbi:MAG: hypothetical protein IJ224_07780 [Lachnospiraceae bacterium]|nr:hypothetical protein [Lachnospiraceae bacterium]